MGPYTCDRVIAKISDIFTQKYQGDVKKNRYLIAQHGTGTGQSERMPT